MGGKINASTISLSNTTSFSGVDNQSYYKLIGLPGQTNFSISTILTTERTKEWNAYWDNGSSSDFQKEYDGTETFNFSPGNAFWIISKNPFVVSKTVSSVALSSDVSYSIPLHTGWNLISNPFNQNVTWSSVKSINSITQPIWSYIGSYTQASTFEPYKGYYYYNSTNLSYLKIPYTSSLGKTSTENIEGIHISLQKNNREIDGIDLMYRDGANDGLDDYDIYSPGDLFTEASINILHPEGYNRNNVLKCDVRNSIDDGQEYILKIRNDEGQSLSIKINENTTNSPVYLVDDELKNVEELDNNINLGTKTKSKTYRLIVGKQEYIEKLKQDYMPAEFRLFQNYPNPFNPTTIIRYSLPEDGQVILKVYDILGKEVNVLVNETMKAGTYEIKFDGSKLSSGVYFARLTLGQKNKNIKLLLMK